MGSDELGGGRLRVSWQGMANDVRTKRVYDPPEADDGYRVLIDHIWPRGVARSRAKLDDWMRDLAPSTELRQWFNHDPARFKQFRTRYRKELREHKDQLDELRRRASAGRVTLIYAARDEKHNNAVVLAELLCER